MAKKPKPKNVVKRSTQYRFGNDDDPKFASVSDTDLVLIKSRRQDVFILSRKGLSIREISKQLNVSESTVRTDLKAIEQEFVDRSNLDFEKHLKQDIEFLYELKSVAYRKFLESCDDALTYQESEVVTKEGEIVTLVSRSVRTQNGDPRYLGELRQLTEQIQKLTGLSTMIKYRDINEALTTVQKSGYEVREPQPGNDSDSKPVEVVEVLKRQALDSSDQGDDLC